MRRASLALFALITAVLVVLLPAGVASAHVSASAGSVAVQQSVSPVSPEGTQLAAPSGPKLDKPETQAEADEAQNKLIIGVVAALLLLIVFLGRRSKNKYKRKVKALQNAKG